VNKEDKKRCVYLFMHSTMKRSLLLLLIVQSAAAFYVPLQQRGASRTRLYVSTSVRRPNRQEYQILGVTPEATIKEIKTAYRKLAKQYHPGMFCEYCM
jgi:DnaJ-domain-containing protein 1